MQTSPLGVALGLCALAAIVHGAVVPRHEMPACPSGARPMLRPDGEPRRCLPHQNSLCVNALPDQPNAQTVCCWHNQVDYFCCLDVTAEQCPDYNNVTVIIHNAFPHSPFALRSYHFREGIEDEIGESLQQVMVRQLAAGNGEGVGEENAVVNEGGILIRQRGRK